MSEQARLRLRSIRTSDELWERIAQTAAAQGRSASQVAAEAMRAYMDGPAGGAARLEEPPEAPAPSPDPHQARSVAPALAVPRSRPPARDEPRALERPDTCRHPAGSRYRGPHFPEHCRACGTRLAPGWGWVVPA